MSNTNEETPCPGCGRNELHKQCPAHGTPYYMSGQVFTPELEKQYKEVLMEPSKYESSNKSAPEGQVYVCSACGKRSKDRYGNERISPGWDISCFAHAVLCYENLIIIGEDGLVTKVPQGAVVANQS